MKKLIYLCSIIMYCLSANAQTFTANPTTVASGADVTFTGSSENPNAYFSVLKSVSLTPINTLVTAAAPTSVVMYNTTSQVATSFKMKFTNPTSSAQTVTVKFDCTTNDAFGGQNTNYSTLVSITVNPVSTTTTYNSAPYSKSFVKSGCSAGYQGSSVTYSVFSGKFTSIVSQAAADQLAVNYVNANGQAYANANGTCDLVYYNTATSKTFTKNNCGAGTAQIGSDVIYTVPANMYNSKISQADANNKAQADINSNGQNYANANGTCTNDITYLDGPLSVFGGRSYVYTLPFLPSGYSVKWDLIGPGYTDGGEFKVDGSSSSVYFNTLPNGTADGTGTLVITINKPGNTSPRLYNYRVEKQIKISYCSGCQDQ